MSAVNLTVDGVTVAVDVRRAAPSEPDDANLRRLLLALLCADGHAMEDGAIVDLVRRMMGRTGRALHRDDEARRLLDCEDGEDLTQGIARVIKERDHMGRVASEKRAEADAANRTLSAVGFVLGCPSNVDIVAHARAVAALAGANR